jgi:hypothetical protein
MLLKSTYNFSFLFTTAFVAIVFNASGQNKRMQKDVGFDSLISYFKQYNNNYGVDSIKLPVIEKDYDQEFRLSKNPIAFSLKDTVLENFKNTYPVSNSILFKNNLVSLFENGSFVCHILPSLKRNVYLEKLLNVLSFQNYWLIDDELIAKSNDHLYRLSNKNTWEKYEELFLLKNRPKLFEDKSYIAFSDCYGEFGGYIYFYNKTSKKLYFTRSTCANSVLEKDKKYFVLSNLAHMVGHSQLDEITNPSQLTSVSPDSINNRSKRYSNGYLDTSNVSKHIFVFGEIQFMSFFKVGQNFVYLANWHDRTFLAKAEDTTVSIINPLFNDNFFSYHPFTNQYGRITLVNLPFYKLNKMREVAIILIDQKRITRIYWNERNNYDH